MNYKKALRSILAFVLALALASGLFPVPGGFTVQTDAAVKITVGAVNTGKLTIPVKSKYKLQAKASDGSLKYKSSKPKVAKVSKKGVVKGIKPGKTVITIKGKGASKKITVKVVRKKQYKKVKKIAIKNPVALMNVGENQTLKVTFSPAKASNKNLIIKSSDQSVATVSEKGIIKAEAAGKTTITVTSCANKKAKDKLTIEVKVPIDWDPASVNEDGVVDPGELSLMEASGMVKVMGDEDSSAPHAIVGQFTDQPVNSLADAKDVFKSIESLFNGFDEEGNVIKADFSTIKESDIERTRMSTPPDETGSKAPDEVFYRYSPVTAQGIPVQGADIILSTDTDGNVSALNSTYDPAYTTIPWDSDKAVGASTAEALARRHVLAKLRKEGPYAIPGTKTPTLYTSSELILFTDTQTLDHYAVESAEEGEEINSKPFYAYKVRVSSLDGQGTPSSDQVPISGAESGEENQVEAGGDGEAQEAVNSDSLPLVDWVVYVDAMTDRVRLSFDDSYNDEWTNSPVNLPCLKGETHSADIRYRSSNSTDNTYQYYDQKRNISIYQIRTYNGKDENGNDLYSQPDYERTAALSFTDKKSGITKNYRTAGTLKYHAQIVYDYYLNTLGRKSYDDNGSLMLIGYQDVLSDKGNSNSFWNDSQKRIKFTIEGKNKVYTRCLDVMGHEFTHGVFRNIVKISSSYGENGALNEAYADIIGESIQGRIKDGNWDHAEDSGTDGKKRPNRNLANPTDYATYVAHYSNLYTQTLKYDKDGNPYYVVEDNGGVHWNSTIFSHAFYRMVTDKRIKGQVSYSRWAQLFYRSIQRITPNSQLIDGRYAVLTEASWMRFTGTQLAAISDAFDAVGLEDPKKITLTLTWGKSPEDLDLHLFGPFKNSYYHIAHNNKVAEKRRSIFGILLKRTLIASLDQDSRTSYGREVIKIHSLEDGYYYALVNNPFGGDSMSSTELANSRASLVVNSPGYDSPFTFNVLSSSSGTCWLAAFFQVTDGKVQFYYVTNKYSDGTNSLYRYGTSDLLNSMYKRY